MGCYLSQQDYADAMRGFCILVGFLLSAGVYVLQGIHLYAFIMVICPLMKGRLGDYFGMLWITVGLIIGFNIVFNHFWAMVLKPGSARDQKFVEKMRTQQKKRAYRKSVRDSIDCEDQRFEGISSDVKKLLRYRTKTIEQLAEFWTKRCDLCNEVRPARAYHCNICQECTLVKDHHCHFVNNCIGLENQRYFLLFLFYSQMGLLYTLFTISSIRSHYMFKEHIKLMTFLTVCDVLLCISMTFFAGYSFFVALYGSTTVELWKSGGIKRVIQNIYNDGSNTKTQSYTAEVAKLRFSSITDNLYRIFGTNNIFRVLSPSFRNVPFTGLEWSFKL